MPIEILIQTPDLIAVNKPSGLSVHNEEDATNLIKTLSLETGISSLLPIHRLDKETSGVQLFALHKKAAKEFSEEFQKRSVRKIYVGVVAGKIEKSGTWNQALSDKAEGGKNPQGKSEDRKECITHFQPVAFNDYFTALEFSIETGRQHQIRKHCTLNRHSLLGDDRYGNAKYNSKIAEIYHFKRLALHCREISIFDFVIKSELPKEFKNLSLF